MSKPKWQFQPYFKRNAFGWQSALPAKRIREAVSEIRKTAKSDSALAGEGAVLLIEKLSPALTHVDSSSGSIGSAVNKALAALAVIIGKADVDSTVRSAWLERLWTAIEDDEIPYLELLGEYWGELCHSVDIASQWADRLSPGLEISLDPARKQGYFDGTSACLASFHHAGRHKELFALVDKYPHNWWHYRQWGVRALLGLGRKAEALRYAEATDRLNEPLGQIASVCEDILLSSGLMEEAYRRYAFAANVRTTNLATYRAIAKKYPDLEPDTILADLIESRPGEEGKWFAAAKDAGRFDLAAGLAAEYAVDPRTLTRASVKFCDDRPDFALTTGLSALRWICDGRGYEIDASDVMAAYTAFMSAAKNRNLSLDTANRVVVHMMGDTPFNAKFVARVLQRQLGSALS